MPIHPVKGGFKVGSGKTVYKTRAAAKRAYKRELAKKRKKKK